MRLELGPERIEVVPGTPAVIVAQVFNTDDVINAYRVRVFGVDDDWVTVSEDRLSLFPGAAGAVTVLVDVPENYPPGELRLGVEVTPIVDPSARQLREVPLVVPASKAAKLSVDPVTVFGGKRTTFNLTVSNNGNTPFPVSFGLLDPEAKVKTSFQPATVVVEPGGQRIVPAKVTGRRPIVGAPATRQLTLTASGGDVPLEQLVTFVQKPLVGRGLISMFGLLLAVSVFAIVLTNTFGRVVDASAVDEAVLKRAIEGVPTSRGVPVNPGLVTGRVTLLTSGTGVSGVTVELFDADAGDQPVASAATDLTGAYRIGDLHEGSYKVRFRGAGFVELWFDDALSFDEAADFDVKLGEVTSGIDIAIGGVPGSIAGRVLGEAKEGATVSLEVPAAALGSASDAQVLTTETDGDGVFLLESVPAPGSYELVVSKEGFATARRVVNLRAAQQLEDVEIRLRRGDGVIAGVVLTGGKPTGGVSVVASNGTDEVSTISLTSGTVGGFTLRGLPTPAAYTLTFTKDGFATENLTVDLGAAQEVTGLSVALASGTGSISGTVRLAGEGPLGGVTVTVTNTEVSSSTQTLSVGDVGSYLVNALPLPGTYTVTFSGPGLATQVRSIDLDPRGSTNAVGVDATLTSATAVVSGTVSDPKGPAGGVAVEISDGGSTTRTAVSANDPPGQYLVGAIPPGTYTLTFRRPGAVPKSVLLTLAAGDRRTVDVRLDPQASISGIVSRSTTGSSTTPLSGAEVLVYRANEFPAVLAARVLTDGSGAYTVPDLPAPEQYIVEFAFPEGSLPQRSVTVTLAAGEQRTGVNATLVLPGASVSSTSSMATAG
jgi:hypothetical protein